MPIKKRGLTPRKTGAPLKRARAVPTRPARHIRSATIRTAILEAARSMYATGGYNSVTIRAIADQLGLAAPSLYHHFVSKEEIFVALQQKTLELLLAIELAPPASDPVDDVRLFYWRYYEFSKDHSDYFSLLYLDRSAPAMDQHMSQSPTLKALGAHASARVRRCVSMGAFPIGTDIAKASNALWAAAHGPAALRFVHRHHSIDFDQVAATSLDLAIAGLRAGAGIAATVAANRALWLAQTQESS